MRKIEMNKCSALSKHKKKRRQNWKRKIRENFQQNFSFSQLHSFACCRCWCWCHPSSPSTVITRYHSLWISCCSCNFVFNISALAKEKAAEATSIYVNHVWLLLIFIFLRKFKEQKQAEIVCGCARSVEREGEVKENENLIWHLVSHK